MKMKDSPLMTSKTGEHYAPPPVQDDDDDDEPRYCALCGDLDPDTGLCSDCWEASGIKRCMIRDCPLCKVNRDWAALAA